MHKHQQSDEDLYDHQYEEMDIDRPEFQEDEPEPVAKNRKWLSVIVSLGLAVVLLGNLLAFFPQLLSTDVIKFLSKSNELSQRADIQQYKKAVLIVEAGDRKGTGFYTKKSASSSESSINEMKNTDGYILTNAHVIDGFSTVSTYGLEGEFFPAKVIFKDDNIDVAVLQITSGNFPSNWLSLSTDTKSLEGQTIMVVGNPLVFNGVANEGKIGQQVKIQNSALTYMSVQAPIYRGNSGSPVIMENGSVAGMIFATSKININGKKTKVGLAIPSEWMVPILQKLP